MHLAEGAFTALNRGDFSSHDHLVKEAVMEMAPQVDLVILAQASMARALDAILESERPVPVFTSPHLALEQVRKLLVPSEG